MYRLGYTHSGWDKELTNVQNNMIVYAQYTPIVYNVYYYNSQNIFLNNSGQIFTSATGVVDAFTHVMEQYLTFKHDAMLQDRFAESILQNGCLNFMLI